MGNDKRTTPADWSATTLVEFFRRAPKPARPLDVRRKRDLTRRVKW